MQATLSYIHVNSGNYNREYPTSSSYMIVEITTGITRYHRPTCDNIQSYQLKR